MVRVSDTIVQRRRLDYLKVVLVVCGVVLAIRLIDLQVLQHSSYASQAASEHTHKFEIPAQRGEIYTRNSDGSLSPLAVNETLETLYADPRYVGNKQQLAQKIAAVTGGNANDYVNSLNHGIEYAVLAKNLTPDIANKIKALKLPGVGLQTEDATTYPEGQLGAQVIGFVNAAGVGQYGIEGYLNKQLSGTPGLLAAKTDTHGIPIATANNVERAPVDGTSYVLTIDKNVQAEAEKVIAAQVKAVHAASGEVVIMDPANGDIRAMANYPTFDPNNYSSQTDYSVFENKAVSDAFEPGSGMKVFTMATGLDKNVVTPNTTYNDPGCYVIDSAKVCNANGDLPGPNKTMTVVLRDSLNTGAMYVLRLLSGNPNAFTLAGKQTLYNYFTKHFGFGKPTGIQLADEAAGQVNLPSNQAGNDVNYANMTFGQGVTATMIQIVSAVTAIANGGTYYRPNVIDSVMNPDGTTTPTNPVVVKKNMLSANAVAQLNQMMQVVVQHGSGYLAANENPGYAIAGKTGTAQIPNPNGGGYLVGKNIGSFIGFAPADHPKFVMMVRINEPAIQCDSGECGYAEYTTVPVFGDICKWLFQYYGIPPGS
jgi:cell division protein FtsI/penicillin-binding protein 2